MQKTLLFIITLFFITCDSPNESNETENMSWVFVANEGSLGASIGSISMIGITRQQRRLPDFL